MFEKTSVGEKVVLVLSLIYAIIITISIKSGSGSYIIIALIVWFIISLIVLYVIYWIIKKVYPKSKYWVITLWILALVVIPIVIIIVLAVVAAFILGMAGSTYNNPLTSPTSSNTQSTIKMTQDQTQQFVMPTSPEKVTEQNVDRVWMECKAPSNPYETYQDWSTRPVCVRANDLYIRVHGHAPSNPYEARGDSARELLQCLQGVGTLDYCYGIADKYGKSHDSMKYSWCKTNSC